MYTKETGKSISNDQYLFLPCSDDCVNDFEEFYHRLNIDMYSSVFMNDCSGLYLQYAIV